MNFESQSKPIWISHRGLKNRAIENTQSAFDAAAAAGFNSFETDLRMSKDGQIVLIHDADLKRIAGSTKLVSSMTRDELNKIELIDGSSILFFDEFVETYAGHNWVLDIKPETGLEVIQKLASWIKSKNLDDWFLSHAKFLVWRASHERALRDLLGPISIYADKAACWRAGVAVILGVPAFGGIIPGRTYSLKPRLGPLYLFKKQYVEQIHNMGARALAYLPETAAESQAALEAGFDEILTNFTPI